MIQFILKRTLYGTLVLGGVITVIFFLFNVLPGDPARMMLGQRADEESIKAIYKDLGLDQPLSTQFGMYLNDLMPVSTHSKNPDDLFYLDPEKYSYTELFEYGDDKVLVLKVPYLRRSYQTKRKVSEIIIDTLPETAVLAVSAVLIATILGIIVGIISALNKGKFIDSFNLFMSILGMSGPSFFMGILIAWVFGYLLSDYTGLNMTGSLYTIDDYGDEYLDLKNLILPAFTLGIRPLSVVMQLTRNSFLEVMSQDYIRTAKAKGLSKNKVIFKHALKNALNPVLTAVSGMFASLMAGALFVENVFAWKGIGWEVYNALSKYDLPVVMGAVLVIATIFVVINIAVDILYGFLDPRIRVK